MSWTEPPTFIDGNKALAIDLNKLRDDLSYLKDNAESPDIGNEVNVDIASGVIIISQAHVAVLPQVPEEPDDLETISFLETEITGYLLFLRAADADSPITVKHDVGNILSTNGADVVLTNDIYVILIYRGDKWIMLAGGLSQVDIQSLIDLSNVNDPTSDEKAALVGTDGTPSETNPYVTSTDVRLGQMIKGTSFPETAEEGDFVYRSDLNKLYKCKETY